MILTSGLLNRINLTINRKKPIEVKENTNMAKPNKNLNKPSIYLS